MLILVNVQPVPQQFPGGTIGGDWFIEAALASAPEDFTLNYVGPSSSTTFEMTDGETYIIRSGRLSAGGNLLGPMLSIQYQVGTTQVTVDVAGSIEAMPAVARPKAKK